MSGANLHKGHRSRVKKRYMDEGLDNFSDHEVVELLLFYSIPRQDTNALAHRMIKEFGTLHDLFEAHPRDIERRCKVSMSTAILISMVAPLSRLYLKQKWGNRPVVNSSAIAGNYALSLFAGRVYECFYVICLNSQNCVNHSALVHEGTINEAPVYPRIIVETALRHKANSIILAHNHPGGSLKASNADIDATRKICQALKTISINVVDHIIVAGDRYLSFAEQGLLDSLIL
ncbi:MAG TPA: DNA repair protein RadC [Clostridiaceae bacterium]|nr:DNA repair protein RadC [Clostridiaceae bacterium]